MVKAKRNGVEIRRYLRKIDNYEEKILAAKNLSEDDLTALRNKDADKIYAKEFYYAVKDAGGNIDEACEEIFAHLKKPNYEKGTGTDSEKTRFANYLKQHIVLGRDIANRINTDSTTLSKYQSGERPFFAYQIHFLAKAQKVSQSEVFEFLYGPDGIGIIS